MSGVRSRGFIGVHAAGEIAWAYSCELCCTEVNCNPNCNPGLVEHSAEPHEAWRRLREAEERRTTIIDLYDLVARQRGLVGHQLPHAERVELARSVMPVLWPGFARTEGSERDDLSLEVVAYDPSWQTATKSGAIASLANSAAPRCASSTLGLRRCPGSPPSRPLISRSAWPTSTMSLGMCPRSNRRGCSCAAAMPCTVSYARSPGSRARCMCMCMSAGHGSVTTWESRARSLYLPPIRWSPHLFLISASGPPFGPPGLS